MELSKIRAQILKIEKNLLADFFVVCGSDEQVYAHLLKFLSSLPVDARLKLFENFLQNFLQTIEEAKTISLQEIICKEDITECLQKMNALMFLLNRFFISMDFSNLQKSHPQVTLISHYFDAVFLGMQSLNSESMHDTYFLRRHLEVQLFLRNQAIALTVTKLSEILDLETQPYLVVKLMQFLLQQLYSTSKHFKAIQQLFSRSLLLNLVLNTSSATPKTLFETYGSNLIHQFRKIIVSQEHMVEAQKPEFLETFKSLFQTFEDLKCSEFHSMLELVLQSLLKSYDRVVLIFEEEMQFPYLFLYKVIVKYLNHEVLRASNPLKVLKNANTLRHLILRIEPLILSQRIKTRYQALEIFKYAILILDTYPIDLNDKTINFKEEEPSNVKIPIALGAMCYELYPYLIDLFYQNHLPTSLQLLGIFCEISLHNKTFLQNEDKFEKDIFPLVRKNFLGFDGKWGEQSVLQLRCAKEAVRLMSILRRELFNKELKEEVQKELERVGKSVGEVDGGENQNLSLK